ncbi:MAG: DoxX family protein [Deltaproteobacteria bacterium]|nr:DoxX family protein [Deltaproteobacteria bacterium]
MTSTAKTPSKGLNIGLWVVQALLALAFIGSGMMKLTTPVDELIKMGMTWAADMPWLPKFIGLSEVLGGLGLILPAATRILPILTPVAAALLTLVMVLGVGVHVATGDIAHSPPAFILGALSAFVAYGRSKLAPIAAR